MPESTITDTTATSEGVPLADRNESTCPFAWCGADHFLYGWDEVAGGEPGRFHENEPAAGGDARLQRWMPRLVVEEARTVTGVVYSDPYVTFDGSQQVPVDVALGILHAVMASAAMWRDIATEFDASAEVVR